MICFVEYLPERVLNPNLSFPSLKSNTTYESGSVPGPALLRKKIAFRKNKLWRSKRMIRETVKKTIRN